MLNLTRLIPFALALSFIVAPGIFVACEGRPDADREDADGEEEPFVTIPVEVSDVVLADLRKTVLGTTTLVAASQVSVTSEIAGELRELDVEEGDRVEAGQRIALIVNEEVRISIDEAQQAVRRAESEVEALRPLFEAGYLARRTFDEAVFQLQSAETNLRRARQTGGAQTVRAPVDGVVIRRTAERGELMVPNQTLVEIAEVDRLEAVIAVPERELVSLREGQLGELRVPALGAHVVMARVSRLDPVVDPQTGTIRVRLALDEAATQGPLRLRPGMFAEVRVVTDVREQVVAVPKRAVVHEGGESWVFVVREPVARPPIEVDGSGEAASRPDPFADLTPYAVERMTVQLGYDDRDVVEVIEGVAAGERVLVIGQSGLEDGAIVVIPSERDAAPPSAAPDTP